MFSLLFCIGATAAFGQLPAPVEFVGNEGDRLVLKNVTILDRPVLIEAVN